MEVRLKSECKAMAKEKKTMEVWLKSEFKEKLVVEREQTKLYKDDAEK